MLITDATNIPKNTMIDFHSHCLPGIDDGSKSVDESKLMLKDSFSQGVTLCTATPHVKVHSRNDIDIFLDKRCDSFNKLLSSLENDKERIPRISLGAELFLDNDVSEFENLNKLCIQNTNLLLCELSVKHYDERYAEWLYSAKVKGMRPILAHIERYPYINELISDLGNVDIIYQINAETVLHRKGRRFLTNCCEAGNTVIVSSDMHNMGLRSCKMKKAHEKLHKHSEELAKTVFSVNPKKILGIG